MGNMNALDYAKMGAKTLMDKFTAETLPPVNHFHYHQGVFLAGVEQVYKLTGDKKYKEYIKSWMDMHIDENGNAQYQADTIFDDVQPCLLLFDLYRETGDERYKIMMDRSFRNVEMWPTNAKGGVWHMKFMDNQMWLDTMYMMGVFTARYAHEFDNPYMFEKLHKQMMLMREYMTNPQNGLLYHVWDDSKKIENCDPETGLIKYCWGRAIGWYVVAIAEMLEYIPENHPLRQDFIDIEIEVLNAIKKYQDKKSGCWYQLVDTVDDSRNWTESSCTALFTYAMAKCLRNGIIDASFKETTDKGYEGTISKTEIRDGEFCMKDICIGTGYGDEQHYYNRPTSENDLHGVGAFLLMCTEVYRLNNE